MLANNLDLSYQAIQNFDHRYFMNMLNLQNYACPPNVCNGTNAGGIYNTIFESWSKNIDCKGSNPAQTFEQVGNFFVLFFFFFFLEPASLSLPFFFFRVVC